MFIVMNQELRDEMARFNLKATCEECRYFCEIKRACAMTYPVNHHVNEAFFANDGERIYFCKMFEVDDA